VRNPLAAPLIPARLVGQALEDLHAIAEAARRLPGIEATLTEQFELLNAQAERILELGERIATLGERLHERGGEILAESQHARDAAHEVAVRGAEVAAALPTLQQLATTAEPLQGAIERFGRIVDRLPGGERRER
jgi:methyl-accepting chemotaxis protein